MTTSSPDVQARLLAVIPRLRRFMWLVTGSLAGADQLLEEMCERLVAGNCGRLPDENADRWLFTLATMIWERRLVSTPPGPIIPAMHSSGDVGSRDCSDGGGDCELSVLHTVLELPLEQRAMLALVCIEGFSYIEAAGILGIPVETLKKGLIDARLVIAKQISSEGDWARSVIANGELVNSPIGESHRGSTVEGRKHAHSIFCEGHARDCGAPAAMLAGFK